MASQAIILVQAVPEFKAVDGMFYIDVGIDRVPSFVASPSVMLRAIIRAHRCYVKWAATNGCTVVSLRDLGREADH